MPITKTFNNTSYSIPLEGELNWSTLSSFLVALADNTQTTNKQKIGTRVATATPVTVLATTDCLIITDLAVAGAVAVNLPAGVTSQVFTVVDGKGDAGTNNITITPAAGTINGAATYVIDSNRAGVTLVYNGTEWTVIAEFISSGDIPRNQIAAGTANHVVINNGSGDLSSEAALAASRGGLATDASAFTGYVKGAAGVFSASAIAAGDLPTGIDATKIADGSVDNTEFQYINSLTSNAQTQINAKVTGAASSTDNAIARFDSTTGKIVQNSGVTVDDSNNVAGVVDITPTTLNSVAIANYLTTTNTKAVTNKDIDGGTASDTSRITIPKASKSTLDGLTRKEGTLVYASDLDKLYADDGSSLKEIGSGGSGINYLADYFTSDTLGTVGNANVTDTGNRSTGTFSAWQSTNTTDISLSVSSSSPLRSPNCYLFSGSGNNASGTKFVESPAFQLHVADLGKPVMVSFDLADVTADGNFDVIMVRYNSSGAYQEKISIAGNASGATPASAKLPTGISKFNGFFIASSTSTDYYALRFRRLAGTDVPRLDSIKISPEQVIQGAAPMEHFSWSSGVQNISNTAGTTDNFANSGTVTISSDVIAISAPSSGTYTLTFNRTGKYKLNLNLYHEHSNAYGSNFHFDRTYGGTATLSGIAQPLASSVAWGIDAIDANVQFSESGLVNVTAIGQTVTVNIQTTYGAVSGTTADHRFYGAISIFGDNGENVTMANRAVEEYAATGGTWDAVSSTTVYGIAGQAMGGTLSASRTKTITFQTPIQATDFIHLEGSNDGKFWTPLIGSTIGGVVIGFGFDSAGSFSFGARFGTATTNSIEVIFAVYANQANDDSPIINWPSSGAYWRVRKVSGGASVGFPVSARNLVGDVSGTTVPSGYIGEKIELTWSSVDAAATSIYKNVSGALALKKGVWAVSYVALLEGRGTGVTAGANCVSYLHTSADSGSGVNPGTNSIYWSPITSTTYGAGEYIHSFTSGSQFVNIPSDTSYYLNCMAQFGSTAPRWHGRLTAIRIA